MTLLDEVRKFIKQYQLINARDKILIGLSGGPDSVCLLYALNALKEEFSLKLYIGHLNHSLRGRESDQDQEFVKKLSEKLKIPAFFKKVDISKAAKTCCSEESARNVRLDFLFQTAKENHLTKIALGHNQDDQAETVLMRLIRGSGLLGLAAILPKRKINDFLIIRPLLGIKRKDIESFLRLKKITPRIDSSNLREIYFRNRLRRTLLPELEKYNPNIKEVLAGTAQTAAYDYDFLYTSASKAFNKIKISKFNPSQKSPGFNPWDECIVFSAQEEAPGFSPESFTQLKLPLKKFLSLHPALQNIILRLGFEELKGDTRRLNLQHIRELRDLIYCRPTGSIVDLPSHISACKKNEFLDLYIRGGFPLKRPQKA